MTTSGCAEAACGRRSARSDERRQFCVGHTGAGRMAAVFVSNLTAKGINLVTARRPVLN